MKPVIEMLFLPPPSPTLIIDANKKEEPHKKISLESFTQKMELGLMADTSFSIVTPTSLYIHEPE
jgi:hypothetical protein